MKTSKTHKSLFAIQLEHTTKEAHELSVALQMVGIGVDIHVAETILLTQEAIKKKGGKFNISDSIDIKRKQDKKYSDLKTIHKNQ